MLGRTQSAHTGIHTQTYSNANTEVSSERHVSMNTRTQRSSIREESKYSAIEQNKMNSNLEESIEVTEKLFRERVVD